MEHTDKIVIIKKISDENILEVIAVLNLGYYLTMLITVVTF